MSAFVKSGLAIGAAVGAAVLAVPASAQFGGPPPPPNTGVPLNAKLSGVEDGRITLVVDPPKGKLCYMAYGVGPATSAEIKAGQGAAAVTLKPWTGRSGGDCLDVSAQVAEAMLANPGNYWVDLKVEGVPGSVQGRLKS